MDDLISRAAAIEAVRGEEEYFERSEDYDCAEAVQGARWKLQEVPAVDAAPVVRCKDCRFATIQNYYGFDEVVCLHPIRPSMPLPVDWFCADGERRDGNGADA